MVLRQHRSGAHLGKKEVRPCLKMKKTARKSANPRRQLARLALAAKRRRYHAYLKSDAWTRLKARKEEATPKVCGGCARTGSGIQLHHMVYRGSLHETQLGDLMWLCLPCHKLAHRAKDRGVLRFKPGRHTPAVMAVMTKAALHRARAWLAVPDGRMEP